MCGVPKILIIFWLLILSFFSLPLPLSLPFALPLPFPLTENHFFYWWRSGHLTQSPPKLTSTNNYMNHFIYICIFCIRDKSAKFRKVIQKRIRYRKTEILIFFSQENAFNIFILIYLFLRFSISDWFNNQLSYNNIYTNQNQSWALVLWPTGRLILLYPHGRRSITTIFRCFNRNLIMSSKS